MSNAKLTVLANGPYIVPGPLVIVDPQGGEVLVPDGENAYLCRCGASKRKPFCDGEHHAIDFNAVEAAPKGD